VRKCINRARRKIAKYTNGAIECKFCFKFFSDDDSDGGNITSFGNYVIVRLDQKLFRDKMHNSNENKGNFINQTTNITKTPNPESNWIP
jgi:hypothetical protein